MSKFALVIACVVGVVGCKAQTSARRHPDRSGEMFSNHTVATLPGESGWTRVVVMRSGEVIIEHEGVTKRIPPGRLDEARRIIEREGAAARADPQEVPIPDLSVSCRIWVDGALHDFRDEGRCMILERMLVDMATAPP